jgi:hypothetical protein
MTPEQDSTNPSQPVPEFPPEAHAAQDLLDHIEALVERLLRPVVEQLDVLTKLVRLQLANWLTIGHAAIVCDCPYDHIYRAVERGELPFSDIGNGEEKAVPTCPRAGGFR